MNLPQTMDREIAALLQANPVNFQFSAATLQSVRDERAALPRPPVSDAVERTDHMVPGDPPVPVRVHRPKGATGKLPCVYSIHGGGYIMGTHLNDDARFDNWCQEFNCVGVSVEYRLAPETAYPGPLEDCYAGLKWTYEHAEELGIDPERVGVFGASAGGGLAAGLALLVRDRGEFPIAFQLWYYPMLDDTQSTPSSKWDAPIWTPGSNTFGWQSYLGDLYGKSDIPGYAVPTRAKDLSGLATTYIMVGTLDGFCDEDIAFAQRLIYAGVPVELHVYPGAPHGFDGLAAGSSLAKRCTADVKAWLGAQLNPAAQ